MRIFALKTDPETGRAAFGTIKLNDCTCLAAEPLERVEKAPGAEAAPHHPKGNPVLLTVIRGTHNIILPSQDGSREEVLPLSAGDQVLFCDFAPEAPVAADGRFHYAGHRSVAGDEGAELQPAAVTCDIDLNQFDWRPGLIR